MRSHGRCRNSGCGNAKMGVAPKFHAHFARVSSSIPHPFVIRLATMWNAITFVSLTLTAKRRRRVTASGVVKTARV